MENIATNARISAGANVTKQVGRAYADLRENDAAWREYMNEVAVWDRLAADGLPGGEDW